jgi:penicillin-binding protein 1A
VTPLELAHAYTTLADDGKRVSGSLSAYDRGPVAITSVKGGGIDDSNDTKMKRVVPEHVAQQATQILQTVISGGTGKAAQIGDFAAGKTGTTEHYQDALFVGYTHTLTVAVWMGYPDGGRAMDYEYHGKPVAGGTYPAEIWRDFMLRAKKIQEARTPDRKKEAAGTTAPTIVVPSGTTDTGAAKPETKRDRKQKSAPAPKTNQAPESGGGGEAPAPEPPPADQVPVTPPPETPPSAGGGAGGGQPPAGGQP